MGVRPAIALVIVVSLAAGACALLLPWAARHPFIVSPELFTRFFGANGGGARSPGYGFLTPVLIGVIIVTACAALYFWMTDFPKEIRYCGRRRRG